MTRRILRSILVIDSNAYGRLDARLSKVLHALGSYKDRATGFASVRDEHAHFHELGRYELAIVHESDALRDGAAFMEGCWNATVPCVIFSGGLERGRTESERLLCIPDADLLRHAEDGIAFLEQFGLLHLTAWTRGARQAVRAEVLSICGRIRTPFLTDESVRGTGMPDFPALMSQLRGWCNNAQDVCRIDRLEQLLTTTASAPHPPSPEIVRAIFDISNEIVQSV